jgi:hypothetical protein
MSRKPWGFARAQVISGFQPGNAAKDMADTLRRSIADSTAYAAAARALLKALESHPRTRLMVIGGAGSLEIEPGVVRADSDELLEDGLEGFARGPSGASAAATSTATSPGSATPCVFLMARAVPNCWGSVPSRFRAPCRDPRIGRLRRRIAGTGPLVLPRSPLGLGIPTHICLRTTCATGLQGPRMADTLTKRVIGPSFHRKRSEIQYATERGPASCL